MTTATGEQIYCLKCRTRTATTGSQQVVLKNGSPAVSGQCAICGAKKFRIGATEQRLERKGRFAQLISRFPGRRG